VEKKGPGHAKKRVDPGWLTKKKHRSLRQRKKGRPADQKKKYDKKKKKAGPTTSESLRRTYNDPTVSERWEKGGSSKERGARERKRNVVLGNKKGGKSTTDAKRKVRQKGERGS